MSGFYNVHIKVLNPNMSNDIPQMRSGGFQPPFFFGGSQIPTTLGLDNNHLQKKAYQKENFVPETIRGKGVQSTNYSRTLNTHIPRKLNIN
jgi:hypothetical protein